MNRLSLNYGDGVVKDLLNKLSSTLNTLNDNNEKTNLIVAGLLKSEVDFPATDRSAILRQFLLRQIGQKCKIHLQTRRSMEEMVIKHIDGLLDLIVDETTDEEQEKSNSSGEVEIEISQNATSTFSSTVPTSDNKIIDKAVKTSELEIYGAKLAQLRKKSSTELAENCSRGSRIGEKPSEKRQMSTEVNSPNVGQNSSKIQRSSRDNSISEVPEMPYHTIGSTNYRNKARKSTNVNVTLSKSVKNELAEVAISSSTQVTDDVDILNVAKNVPEIITIDDDDEMPKTVGKMKSRLPKRKRIIRPQVKKAKKLKFERRLQHFFGEEIFDYFCQVSAGFESDVATPHVWTKLVVLYRDVWRKRFVEFLRPKLLPADYVETLLIMLDVKFDKIVRPGVIKAQTEHFYYPPPAEGRILLRNPTAEIWHKKFLQFDPPKLYYEMCHLVGRICEKLNIDPNPV